MSAAAATHAIALAAARMRCAVCMGRGVRETGLRCSCAERHAWRAVIDAWQYRLYRANRCIRTGAHTYSMPAAEYGAEIWLAARHAILGYAPPALPAVIRHAEELWLVLRLAYAGMDHRSGMKRTGLDRGTWFHRLYRAEALAGGACIDSGLYPAHQYFGSIREIPDHGLAETNHERRFTSHETYSRSTRRPSRVQRPIL